MAESVAWLFLTNRSYPIVAVLNISLPLIIFVLGFITFEVTMGLIVMAVPNRKHHQGWDAADKKKVRRIVIGAIVFWPAVLLIVAVHVYLSQVAIILFDTALAVGLILLIGHGLRHRKKKSLVEVGHCPACHYDLVGSAHASHCPECGHLIPEPIRQAAMAREAALGVRSAMDPGTVAASAEPSAQRDAEPSVSPSQPAGA
ncbi:MAG: hypothetical protein AAF797_16035 [Planctomycetota bacterium]